MPACTGTLPMPALLLPVGASKRPSAFQIQLMSGLSPLSPTHLSYPACTGAKTCLLKDLPSHLCHPRTPLLIMPGCCRFLYTTSSTALPATWQLNTKLTSSQAARCTQTCRASGSEYAWTKLKAASNE